jgi:predicted ATPase
MKLKSLSVKGYKSIRHLESFEFRDINILIGANGAGKSNLISLFRMLSALSQGNLQTFVQKQGGLDSLLFGGRKKTSAIELEFVFGPNSYYVRLEPTVDNRLIFAEEKVRFRGDFTSNHEESLGTAHEETKLFKSDGRPQTTVAGYVASALRQWRVYHFHDTSETATVKGRHASNDNLELKPDASNLAAYIALLRKDNVEAYNRIVSTIQLAAPFFGGFVIRDPLPDTIELEWTERGDASTPYRAHALSDGTLRFICLTTLLLQPEDKLPDTVLIDEPELGLHPYAIHLLAEMIKRVAESKQVILSTQSVELLNEFVPEDIIVVDRVDGASTFHRLDKDTLKDWLEDYSLGELWNRNILGGRPSGVGSRG